MSYPLTLAFDCGMNLAPVSVEHSHGDCARRPRHVGDKFERAHAASRVGAQFPNDIRRTVKILDSVLHFRSSRSSILVHRSVATLPAALRIAAKEHRGQS